METIIEMLERFTNETPETSIIFDETYTKGLSYAKLDDMSGRIYNYLKKNKVGKNDFVLINLPRGVMPVITMIGVWKAGAAWSLVEDTYAPERIAYIRKDCGCICEISSANWEEIMNEDYLAGHENPGEHDAAYAIYTSGTTGNPKGVLHEYGNLERAIESIKVNGETPFNSKDRLALLAPLNFVASIIVILKALSIQGGKMFIVSYATIKNPTALKFFFFEKKISITFLTPSYVRMLGNTTGPFLRMLFVGSEPANNIFNKNLDLINIYACSESGFAVGVFKIDRAYDTCPIGRPEVETKIVLLDEDGKEVPDGEIGELCFENPYVRGYINLDDETKKVFVDGIYHTGDLARIDENGNYVLLGRSGDMIKINGNRIEPAEIEAAMRETLGISWAAARGFDDNGKSYLCAYYKDDVKFDANELREKLLKRLPYYMIPAYFVKVDSIPLKANGKLDRKALPKPDAKDFRSEYEAPTSDAEKAICAAMEKVLKLDKMGINDDFYELGGDSLGSIEVIVNSNLPGLTANEIFRGRTPKEIAKLYEEKSKNRDTESPEVINSDARKKEHPLTEEQLYMVDYQLYTPKSTMYNLYSMLKFDKDTFEMNKLADVMKTVIKNHSSLLTTLHFNDDGEIVQKYTPEIFEDIKVEKTSEFEFENIKDSLVMPFKIIGGRLYRARIFETEKNGYVFFDVHHTIFDGTSMKVFMNNISQVYMGMMPENDYYYYMLQKREEVKTTDFYLESKKYFEDIFDNYDWANYPTIDHESRENEYGEVTTPLGIEQPQMKAVERYYRISRNEFFIAVATLAIAIYNNKNDVKISWIYNGRTDVELMSTVGLLFRDLPIGMHFNDDMTLRDIYKEVHNQVQGGIEHSCYPYVDLHNYAGGGESAYLLYQQDIRDMGADGMNIQTVGLRQNQAASQTILDMQVLDGKSGLAITVDYAASRYEEESISKYSNLFIMIAQTLATHISQTDLTFKDIKEKVTDKKTFFEKIFSIFKKKK